MNRRIALWVIGVCVGVGMAGWGGGCASPEVRKEGSAAPDYAAMPPAVRLLAVEIDGPTSSPQAAQALADLLNSPDPLYRAQAAQIAATTAARGNPYSMMPVIRHRCPLVRSIGQETYIEYSPRNFGALMIDGNLVEVPPALLSALAELGDRQGLVLPETVIPPLQDQLHRRLDGDPAEAVLAADLLARVGDVGARRTLIRLVGSAEDPILARAAKACVRDDLVLGPTLLPPAFGGGVLARRAVMETLVLHPDPRLKNLPLKGLKDKDLAVRHNAIRALGNMSAAAPVQELVAELNQPLRKQAKPAQAEDEAAPETEAESIRIQEKADVIRALGAIGQPAADALRQYLKRGAEARMLEVTALLAFASSANRDDIPWVSARLASDDKYVRAGALTVLGRIGNPEAQAAVMACAGDADPLVRATAAKALGLIGTVYASKQLVAMLEDASPLVVSMAAWGLGKATYGEAVPALKKVLKGRTASESGPAKAGDLVAGPELAAVEALGKIGGAEAVAALIECLGSRSWRMRATAAQALGAAGDRSPAAMEALDKRLQDSNCLVRAQTLLSLKALGRQFEAGHFQTK